MRKLTNELKNKKIDPKKLLNFGFIKKEHLYRYEKNILQNKFKIIINFQKENTLTSKIIELETNEEYILADVPNAKGEFVGKVKSEYDNLIQQVINSCTTNNVFKHKQSLEVIKYIKDKYNDELEFLWEKFDENAIWRNKETNKWYAALLKVPENKINNQSDEIVEIIDLKYPKEDITSIIDNKTIFPGYHMNKKHWITIILNDSLATEEIYKYIDISHNEK